MSCRRASMSPALYRRRSSMVSSLFNTFSLDVFTPQISTFPCIKASMRPMGARSGM